MSEDRVVDGLPTQAFDVMALPDGRYQWQCVVCPDSCWALGVGGVGEVAALAGAHVAAAHPVGRFRAVSPSGRVVVAGDDLAQVRGAAMVWEARMRLASPEEHRAGCACTGGFCWSARLFEIGDGEDVVREFVVDPADALVCTVCGHEAMDFQAGSGGLVCVDCPTGDPSGGLTADLAALQRLPLSTQDGGRECGDDPDIEVTRGYFGGRAELLAPELFAAGSAAAAAVVESGPEPGRRLPPAVGELVRVTVEGRVARALGGGFKVVAADPDLSSGVSLARLTELGLQRAWIEPVMAADGRRWVSLTNQLDTFDLMAQREAEPSEEDTCTPGDPDPCSDNEIPCGFEWPDRQHPQLITWSCVRAMDHRATQHVAVGDGQVVSVCPMPAGLVERLAPGGAL
jgi:hypothetical protein